MGRGVAPAAQDGSYSLSMLPPPLASSPEPTCSARRSLKADFERTSGLSPRRPLPAGPAPRVFASPCHAPPLSAGNKRLLTSPPAGSAEPGSAPSTSASSPGPPRVIPPLPGAAPPRARRRGPSPALASPSWHRLETTQPRFENSSPLPPPPDGRQQPPVATTPAAQTAP